MLKIPKGFSLQKPIYQYIIYKGLGVKIQTKVDCVCIVSYPYKSANLLETAQNLRGLFGRGQNF